ncbi:MAG: thioredoxin family protein [Desulfobulbaceae bacterium]|nr:thioredoxin family protein [Desulfobulbaceae bacterium]
MRPLFSSTLILLALLTCSGVTQAGNTSKNPEIIPGIPVENTVTLVDLGAKTCIPCKLMAPILAELKKEYAGRAEVIFIDVWDQANAGKAQAFKVMTIPTQIFYDRQGREIFRHAGFFEKKAIVTKLDELIGK